MATSKLNAMEIVKRPKDYNWKVICELGSGGYGSVYKVTQVQQTDGALIPCAKEYAMKTEGKTTNKGSSRLKIEKNVMAKFKDADASKREHFPELMDSGQTLSQKWIVMTLVGPSLESLKKTAFSQSTALQCGIQTLKSVHDIHAIGFLHRDLKPANFCVGQNARADTVYMIDFGLARMFKQNDGTIRPSRKRTKMIGTPRYCARASHQMFELARKDDYESWFFLLIDLIDPVDGLKWRGKTRDEAFALKQQMFEPQFWTTPFSSRIPLEFHTMTDYLNSLEYSSDVEFGIFRDIIMEHARKQRLTLHETLDWMDPNRNAAVAPPSVAKSAPAPSQMRAVSKITDVCSLSTEETEGDSMVEKTSKSKGSKKARALFSKILNPF